MKSIPGEYRRRCRKQPLGTRESAECIKKLAESIILQCFEDLWDRVSMKQSTEFFSRRGFSICASIAGMDICEQMKLLELVNCAIAGIRRMKLRGSMSAKTRVPSTFARNNLAGLRTVGGAWKHNGLQL